MLDAGCGTGGLVAALAETFPTTHFVGIDFSDESLSVARSNHGMIQNLEFQQHDLMEPLSAGDSYDIVTSIGVIHHLIDPSQGLSNINRVLHKDGSVILFLYGKYGRFREKLISDVLSRLAGDLDWTKRFDILDRFEQEDIWQTYLRERGTRFPWLPRFVKAWMKSRVLRRDPDYLKALATERADTFFNPIVHRYNLDDIYELLEVAGFEFHEINEAQLGNLKPSARLFKDPKLTKLYEGLNNLDRLAVAESMTLPRNYMFSARKVREIA